MGQSNEDCIRFANDEIINNANLGVVSDVFASDYVVHAGGKHHGGLEFVTKFVKQLRKSIPDVRVVDVEVLLQSGDTVAWQRTFRGTHEASLKGIPASGRRVEWRDMMVSRFEGGKIAEEWAISELAGELMLKQPRA